ncbi:unnamed protein product, partial [Musa hybrid cultivar]
VAGVSLIDSSNAFEYNFIQVQVSLRSKGVLAVSMRNRECLDWSVLYSFAIHCWYCLI